MAPSSSVLTSTSETEAAPSTQGVLRATLVPAAVEEDERRVTPNEAISLGDVLPDIPTFSSFREHRRHILVHMAAVFRHWARMGYTEGQSGHISVRDPEHPHLMWMNPLSRHFGSLRAGDMICLEIATGRIVAGPKNPATGRRTVNKAGYYIHSAIHKARPDAHAVCHAHTIAGRAWSAFAQPLEMLTQDVCSFYKAHTVYNDYGGIVFAGEEGERIAASLGPHGKGAILMNHGLLTVGSTVDEAGFLFGLLDRSCAIQLQADAAAANGRKKMIISDEEASKNFEMASEAHVLYREGQADIEYEIEAIGGEDEMARGFDALAFEHSIRVMTAGSAMLSLSISLPALSVFVLVSGTFLMISGTYGAIVGPVDPYHADGGTSAWSGADNPNSS